MLSGTLPLLKILGLQTRTGNTLTILKSMPDGRQVSIWGSKENLFKIAHS